MGPPIIIDNRGDATTPARPIDVAKGGGTLFWLESTAPAHLDPQQINASDEQAVGTVLFRRLTGYIEDPDFGPLTLVGDLATNTGETTDGGKTWTYHLRDGISFSDGTPITSKDIAYGIARSFGPSGDHGPQFVQDALDPARLYSGPNVGDAPGIATPDNRTIRFTLSTAHPEWPFLMALPTSTPVPRARDSGARYEVEWVASGPYTPDGTYDPTTTLILKKNPNWDPRSDPIRHQYLDRMVFDFRAGSRDDQTNRLIADEGDDQYAVATDAVALSQIATVQSEPWLLARTGKGPTPSNDYIAINTRRVSDISVRRALNWSFDRKAYAAAAGGDPFVHPATWILAPIIAGWMDYDAFFSADGHGDVRKARDLLAGATPTLTYCFPGTPAPQPLAAVVRDSLQRAGFRITLNPIDPSRYDATIGDRTNTCDLMRSSWTTPYPDGQSTLDALVNGEHITVTGNLNYSLFDEPAMNAKIDNLNAEPNRIKAADGYGRLDVEIMQIYAPLIPTYFVAFFNLHGSKVHVQPSRLYAEFNLVNAWVG